MPVNQLAEIADKLLRNTILTPNEMRMIIGYQPVEDEKADELRNPNLNEPTPEGGMMEEYPATDDGRGLEGQSQGVDESDPSALMNIGFEILDQFTNDTG